jgi:hypothetical protein
LYGAYKQKFFDGDWVLGSAFLIMFFLGFCKYVERAWALWQAGFPQIRKSNKEKPLERFSAVQHENEKLDSDDALLHAHGLLGITVGAFADYSVKKPKGNSDKPFKSYSSRDDVVKVVEMELSLMYDMMYTKAAAIHTRRGYILRLTSPGLTATALLLFLCHGKEGLNSIDISITYLLLIGTWLLDVTWLLRALGSTWTYVFLQGTECDLLKQTLCSCRRGRWYGLRRLAFSLDPLWLSLVRGRPRLKELSSHRIWSRTIGQHNLLHECTAPAGRGTPMKKIGWEDWEGNVGVKSLLQEVCKDILKQYDERPKKEEEQRTPTAEDYLRRRTFGDARRFGPEFEELVITWHIATDVFLLCWPETGKFPGICRKIKALSDYMMFLVAERPEMLPGLKLHSHYENIRDDLKNVWKNVKNDIDGSSQEEKLARELRRKRTAMLEQLSYLKLHRMLQEAIVYAEVLVRLCDPMHLRKGLNTMVEEVKMGEETVRRLLILVPALQDYAELSEIHKIYEFFGCTVEIEEKHVFRPGYYVLDRCILQSWVRLLIFASVRCSRDSHAKQLSCGGELTTIIWILAEHSEIVEYRRKRQN